MKVKVDVAILKDDFTYVLEEVELPCEGDYETWKKKIFCRGESDYNHENFEAARQEARWQVVKRLVILSGTGNSFPKGIKEVCLMNGWLRMNTLLDIMHELSIY